MRTASRGGERQELGARVVQGEGLDGSQGGLAAQALLALVKLGQRGRKRPLSAENSVRRERSCQRV